MAIKVIICGGREFNNKPLAYKMLDRLRRMHGGFSVVITGGARGADAIGKQWAGSRGIHVIEVKADWDTHKTRAGYVRNRKMLDDHKPDRVIAFPGGRGTAHMMQIARSDFVRVDEIFDNG